MAFKFAIDDRGTSVPPRSQVGRLSTDLDEGMKVTLSDGEQVSWNPPPANPVIPDLSKIKQLAKYFNRGISALSGMVLSSDRRANDLQER